MIDSQYNFYVSILLLLPSFYRLLTICLEIMQCLFLHTQVTNVNCIELCNKVCFTANCVEQGNKACLRL